MMTKYLVITSHGRRQYSVDWVIMPSNAPGPVYVSQEAMWYPTADAARADAAKFMNDGEVLLVDTFTYAALQANYKAWKAAQRDRDPR